MSAITTVGSQYRFQATITKDGNTWDLTGASVIIWFKRPDNTTFSKTGSLLVAASGQVYYDCTATDLNQAGNWTRSWYISLSSKVDFTDPIQFTVLASP